MPSLCPSALPPARVSSLAEGCAFRGSRRYHASPFQGRQHHSQRYAINTDSLPQTLDTFRRANRGSRLRYVPLDSRDPKADEPSQLKPNLRKQKRDKYLTPHAFQSLIRRLAKSPSPSLPSPPSVPQAGSQQTASGLRTDPRHTQILANFLDHIDSPTKTINSRLQPNPRRTQKKKKFSPEIADGVKQDIQCPWLDHTTTRDVDGISRLGEEMRAFELYMSDIPQEQNAVHAVIDQVTSALDGCGLDSPNLVGSRGTGTSMRHSNINLRIPIDDPDPPQNGREPSATRPVVIEKQAECLAHAARLLRGTAAFSDVTLERSRIPSVIATHSSTGLSVQLYCSIKTPVSMDYILNYTTEFPTLRPLFIVLRMILETRNMFGTRQKTVDSYGLAVMIVAALKLGEGTYARHDLGSQLLHVLQFYKDFNYRRFGIAVEPPIIFTKQSHRPPRTANSDFDLNEAYIRGQSSIGRKSLKSRSDMLCLQDPANYMNDLGMWCFWTLRVKELFEVVHDEIRNAVQAWDGKSISATSKSIIPFRTARMIEQSGDNKASCSLLHFALGANYDRFEDQRDKIILGSNH